MKPQPHVDHPLHPFILNRWSPRSFALGTPLTEETVLTLLEEGRVLPLHAIIISRLVLLSMRQKSKGTGMA